MKWKVEPREDGGLSATMVPLDYEAQEGEVVKDFIPDESYCWDSGDIRKKNDDELLDDAQEDKIEEMADEVVEDMLPFVVSDQGDREILYALAKQQQLIVENLPDVELLPPVAALISFGDKAMQKRAEIENAPNKNALDNIHWDG